MKGKFQNISWPISIYMYRNELLQYRNGQWNAAKVDQKKTLKVPVCILTKDHYVEVTKCYPINNLVHLYQVIKAEAKVISPYGTPTVWSVTGYNSIQKAYTVTYWSLKVMPMEIAEKFQWFVPESLILKDALEENVAYRLESVRPKYFLYNEGIGTKVILEDSLVPTIQRFVELVHGSESTNTESLSHEKYERILALGAKSLSPAKVIGLRLVLSNKERLSFNDYKWPLIGVAALFSLYGSGIALYQSNALKNLTLEVENKQQAAEVVLANENQALKHMAIWKQYTKLKADYPGITNVYLKVAEPLAETQAELTNIRLQGNAVSLYGVAPSATKTFEHIASVHGLDDVKLDGNISVDRKTKKERFIIKLTYKEAENDS